MPDPAIPLGSDAEWDDLLRHLRQPAPEVPAPFFYAQVQARLAARASVPAAVLPRWLRRPVYAALLALLIVAVSGDSLAAAHHQAARPLASPRLP